MEFVDLFVQNCTAFLSQFGYIAGVLLILLESIIPALPLSVFITMNLVTYGNVAGFLISWASTILGCSLSFFLFRSIFRDKLYQLVMKHHQETLSLWLKQITHISFSSLVLILALPFTPAFFVNIAAGLSKMNYRKFLLALLIGKLAMVYFWGYVGTSLLESLTDIGVLVKIVLLLLGAYLLSRLVDAKMNVK